MSEIDILGYLALNSSTKLTQKYVPIRISTTVVVEILLAIYCLFGVASSIYFLEIAAVPFQLLFFLGFAFVSFMSVKHAWIARHMNTGKGR